MQLRLAGAAAAALGIGCSSAPQAPVWTRDVRPILEANCIKCHGASPRGGAPPSFRLDVFEPTFDDLGRRTEGAELMAQFVSARTHAETMPPVATLAGVQIETITNWYNNGSQRGDPGDDAAPTIALVEPLVLGDDGFVTVRTEIRDPDFDVVTGSLVAAPVGGAGAPIAVTSELYSGRGDARWDALAAAPGRYELRATINDGQRETDAVLDSFDVPAGADGAPTVAFTDFPPEPADFGGPPPGTLRDRLIADAQSPIDVALELGDRDGDDLSLVLTAERGTEVVQVASLTGLRPGAQTISLDTGGLGEGGNWWLRAQVEDGTLSREAVAGPLVIGHGDTDLTFYDDIAGRIFGTYCSTCHPQLYVPALDIGDYAVVTSYAGRIYRRVVQEESMPPRSAYSDFGVAEMTAADRALLAEWILGGIPEGVPPQ